MKIALIVDNPFRDLPSLVLTALEICREHGVCFLVPASLKYPETWCLAPDFVLLNNLRVDKLWFVRRALEAGMRLGVLDTEGGVFTSLEHYGRDLVKEPEVLQGISCFCSWGPRLAEFAVQSGWFSPQQVQVTGLPRFDFYTEPWRRAALALTADAAGFPPPLVLLNSNFSLANPLFRTPEEAAQAKMQLWDREETTVQRELETERQALAQLVALARRLAERLPEIHFVYRPHPFENPGTYRHRLAGRPNLHLVKRGAVDGWILRACAVVQRGCSTAIEASLAGLPALAPSWIPAVHDLEAVESVSIPCPTEDDLIERLRSAAAGHPNLPTTVQANLGRVLSDWFFTVDGRGHQRVAQTVLRAAGNGGSRVSLDYCSRAAHHLLGPQVSLGHRLRTAVRREIRLGPDWSFRRFRHVGDASWDGSQRAFGVEDVRAIASALEPLAPGRWPRLQIHTAQELGCYHFHYRSGRSVALSLV